MGRFGNDELTNFVKSFKMPMMNDSEQAAFEVRVEELTEREKEAPENVKNLETALAMSLNSSPVLQSISLEHCAGDIGSLKFAMGPNVVVIALGDHRVTWKTGATTVDLQMASDGPVLYQEIFLKKVIEAINDQRSRVSELVEVIGSSQN